MFFPELPNLRCSSSREAVSKCLRLLLSFRKFGEEQEQIMQRYIRESYIEAKRNSICAQLSHISNARFVSKVNARGHSMENRVYVYLLRYRVFKKPVPHDVNSFELCPLLTHMPQVQNIVSMPLIENNGIALTPVLNSDWTEISGTYNSLSFSGILAVGQKGRLSVIDCVNGKTYTFVRFESVVCPVWNDGVLFCFIKGTETVMRATYFDIMTMPKMGVFSILSATSFASTTDLVLPQYTGVFIYQNLAGNQVWLSLKTMKGGKTPYVTPPVVPMGIYPYSITENCNEFSNAYELLFTVLRASITYRIGTDGVCRFYFPSASRPLDLSKAVLLTDDIVFPLPYGQKNIASFSRETGFVPFTAIRIWRDLMLFFSGNRWMLGRIQVP